MKGITVERSPDNTTTYEAYVETFEQSCKPNSMLFNITISFPRGMRRIEHTLSDARPTSDPVDVYEGDGPVAERGGSYARTLYLALPAEPKALEEWNQRIAAALPISNDWVLLDALGSVLGVEWYANSPIPEPDECKQRGHLKNGITIYDCFSTTYGTHASPNNTGLSPLSYFSSYSY
jgi:hypothetical protein